MRTKNLPPAVLTLACATLAASYVYADCLGSWGYCTWTKNRSMDEGSCYHYTLPPPSPTDECRKVTGALTVDAFSVAYNIKWAGIDTDPNNGQACCTYDVYPPPAQGQQCSCNGNPVSQGNLQGTTGVCAGSDSCDFIDA
jgi:hypothetical protein